MRHKIAYEPHDIAPVLQRSYRRNFVLCGARLQTMRNLGLASCIVLASFSNVMVAVATPLDENAEHYRSLMIESIGESLTGALALRDRVAANDVEGAKSAWISARAGWERSEVFTAGFVPELDAMIDAWPNATSGFHAIEARLFGAGRSDVADDADQLVKHLDDLHQRLQDMRFPAQGVLAGTCLLYTSPSPRD